VSGFRAYRSVESFLLTRCMATRNQNGRSVYPSMQRWSPSARTSCSKIQAERKGGDQMFDEEVSAGVPRRFPSDGFEHDRRGDPRLEPRLPLLCSRCNTQGKSNGRFNHKANGISLMSLGRRIQLAIKRDHHRSDLGNSSTS
jgi:hypothetical protein